MDGVLDDIVRVSRRCKRTSKAFDKDPLYSMKVKIEEGFRMAAEAWSQSPLGYHAHVYVDGYRRPQPGEVFDAQYGLERTYGNRTQGRWRQYSYDEVSGFILGHAGLYNFQPFQDASDAAREAFEDGRRELLTTIDALLKREDDATLKELKAKIANLHDSLSQNSFLDVMVPKNGVLTNDYRAANGGRPYPHHIVAFSYTLHLGSYGLQVAEMANLESSLRLYLEKTLKMKGTSVAKTEGKIFIGHGGSRVWMDLEKFLTKLGLDPFEFNSVPTAGKSNKERLIAMLDEACFAFLVLTAEDEQIDGSVRARESVVHEVGLFQGRLSWDKAIVLLEEGCNEFSNMNGIQEIRFPKGNIMAKTEAIRDVLQREHILK